MLQSIVWNEKGSVMFLVLFCTLCISVLGLTAYYIANTEVTESSERYEEAKALYLAEAGLQRAIAEMTSGMDDGWDDEVAGIDGEQGTEDDGILSFGPQVYCAPDQGDYTTNESDEISSPEIMSRLIGHYEVRIQDGRRPGQETGPCNKVVLASTGVSSKSFEKSVEAEIELFDLPRPPATVFIVPGAKTSGFPDPDFHGQSWSINGNDTNTDGTPGIEPSLLGIASNASVGSIVSALKDNQKDQVMGTGYDITTSPITPSIDEASLEMNVTKIIKALRGMDHNPVAPGTYSSFTGFGGTDDYPITVCDGDLSLTGQVEGSGVLVVTGNLVVTGQGNWNGYILCQGDARFTGGGTGFHLYGCLMLGTSSGLESISNFTICGNADLSYSHEAVEQARADVRTVQVNYWRSAS